MNTPYRNLNRTLLFGDFIALALVTLVGFFNHNQQFLPGRYLATALPLMFSWLLTAPWMGLLANEERLVIVHSWWKIGLAVLLATPLGLLIRSLILGSSLQVAFALVMVLVSAAALLLWRLIWGKFLHK